MKNILFISSYPFPLDKGSNQHAFFFIKALSARYNVYCLFFAKPGHSLPKDLDTPLTELGIKAYELCSFSKSRKNSRIASVLHRILAFPGAYMNLATHSEGKAAIDDMIRHYAIDIVHIEHFHYAKYAFGISSKLKKTIVYHDLYHTLYSQKASLEASHLKKLLLWVDCWKFYVFEKCLDLVVDCKIFLNTDEMAKLPRKALHIPHLANPAIQFRRQRSTNWINMVFVGAYKHPPNIKSVELIIDRILPPLVKRTERFTLHIVGSGTEQFQALLSRSPLKGFVSIRGFVTDINDVFKDMDIAFFPICYGGGIKTKILDAMSAGVPIVTTPEGLIGLRNVNGSSIAKGKTPAELVEQLIYLMNNEKQRIIMAKSAKDYVNRQNSYQVFAERIYAAYRCV
jgi:glycosyltransferase involved in cell wall biosynthesis